MGAVRPDLDRTSTAASQARARVSSVGKHGWSYSGIAWTDRDGRAVVTLPLFARLHDAGFEYELATVDSQSSVELTDEIVDGHFAVATDEPHVKVRWRVTAYRSRGDESRRR
jgi:hypothetical protein